jgi:predicted anti-sigma-YlaC factor YlaD
MKCHDLLKALNEYIDGNKSLPLCAEFEDHLAGCNPCRVVVDNIRQTIELYKDDKPYPMPDEFRRRLHSSLKASWERHFVK